MQRRRTVTVKKEGNREDVAESLLVGSAFAGSVEH